MFENWAKQQYTQQELPEVSAGNYLKGAATSIADGVVDSFGEVAGLGMKGYNLGADRLGASKIPDKVVNTTMDNLLGGAAGLWSPELEKYVNQQAAEHKAENVFGNWAVPLTEMGKLANGFRVLNTLGEGPTMLRHFDNGVRSIARTAPEMGKLVAKKAGKPAAKIVGKESGQDVLVQHSR